MATHGIKGWCIGPYLDHYRCYNCYITITLRERDTNNVNFFPSRVKMPKLSSTNKSMRCVGNITNTLLHPAPVAAFNRIGEKQQAALTKLTRIF